MKKILLHILAKIEKMANDVTCFAYKEQFGDGTLRWCVAVSDYNLYFSKEFKDFAERNRRVCTKLGEKVFFVCQTPKNDFITNLYNQDNLLVNV